MTTKWTPLPELITPTTGEDPIFAYELFPLEEFRDLVGQGIINDEDGSAMCATETHMSDENYFNLGFIPDETTHVAWFSK